MPLSVQLAMGSALWCFGSAHLPADRPRFGHRDFKEAKKAPQVRLLVLIEAESLLTPVRRRFFRGPVLVAT